MRLVSHGPLKGFLLGAKAPIEEGFGSDDRRCSPSPEVIFENKGVICDSFGRSLKNKDLHEGVYNQRVTEGHKGSDPQ